MQGFYKLFFFILKIYFFSFSNNYCKYTINIYIMQGFYKLFFGIIGFRHGKRILAQVGLLKARIPQAKGRGFSPCLIPVGPYPPVKPQKKDPNR